jgi:hypothetical protein
MAARARNMAANKGAVALLLGGQGSAPAAANDESFI